MNKPLFWRVVARGLAAGGVYVVLWVVLLHTLFTGEILEGLIWAAFFSCMALCAWILLWDGSRGWGWSFLLAVIGSFAVNMALFFCRRAAPFLFGAGEMPEFGGLLVLWLLLRMILVKALTAALLLIAMKR